MYFLTIVLAVIFIICALAVEEAGLAAFLVILSVIMIVLSAILIYRDYKKSKNTTYKPQFFDNDTPTTVDKSGYGYSMDNPIYTSSVHNAYSFLDNLRTSDGKKIKYKRSGAYYGVVCNGKKETAVDKYEITVSGRVYATLYICPYGKDSNKVPNGFSLQTKPLNKKQAMEKAIANSSNDDINKLCDGLETEPQTMKMAFPGGERQKGSVVRSLCKIFNINSSDALMQKKLVRIYLDVLVRKVIIKCSDEDILSSLKINHKDLIKTEETANSVMTYIFMNMMNNDFEIKSDEDLEMIGIVSTGFAENEESSEENEVHQTESLDDAEYGLVPEKPIYTNGVSDSNAYLERLTTTLGEKLSWERQGSMSVDGINGMIDIYEGYLPSGKRYKTLFVNMYGTANSTTAPKGFRLSGLSNDNSFNSSNKTQNITKINLCVSMQTLEIYLDEIYKIKAQYYNVPGFRRGHAPRDIVEKMYGDSIFWDEAVALCIDCEGAKKLKTMGLKSSAKPVVKVIRADRDNGITAELEYQYCNNI